MPAPRFNPTLQHEVAMDETDDKKLIHLLWRTMAYMHQVRDELNVLKNLVREGDQREQHHRRPLNINTSYLREECQLENVWEHAKNKILSSQLSRKNSQDSGVDPEEPRSLDSAK